MIGMMAAMVVLAGQHPAPATVELTGPAGAELLIDDRASGRFDAEGRMLVLLSAEHHRLTVMQDGRVVESHDVAFGAGAKIKLEMDGRSRW
jgi:hypothetical protein